MFPIPGDVALVEQGVGDAARGIVLAQAAQETVGVELLGEDVGPEAREALVEAGPRLESSARAPAPSNWIRAKNVHCRDIRAGEGAIVQDLLHTYSGRRDLGCQIGQTAGSITYHSGESPEPAVRHQAPFNYTT